MPAELELAPKVLVLQERGVNDGSGEDSKETSPGAPSACESVQMGHGCPAESRVLFQAAWTQMGYQAWQGSHSTPCSEQPGRVKHKASGFLGTLRSPQHIPLCPQSWGLNSHCLRGCAYACLLQVSPPAFPLCGDRLLSLKAVIRKWRAFKNTAIKSNKNNRAGTYVSPQAHPLLLSWIEVFYHQSLTAC